MDIPPHKENQSLLDGARTKKAIEDWNQGKKRLEQQQANPQTSKRKALTAIQRAFTQIEKHKIEPFANLLNRADIFRIIEKLSPVIEAIGIIAIPLVIWYATQSAQEAKDKSEKAARAQEAVKNYLNQLSTVFLDGSLETDDRLRTVTRASTLALLNDPNLDGEHKGQVIEYLTELNLVSIKTIDPEIIKKEDKTKVPLISLAFSNLKDAKLFGANLRGANLEGANLRGADLTFADLKETNLKETNLFGTNLKETDLSGVDLRGMYLRGANLKGARLVETDLTVANLEGADLRGANLRGANLKGTSLSGADLSGATLLETDLSKVDLFWAIFWTDRFWATIRKAKLCKTKLPSGIELDPNRDCKKLEITP